MKNKIILSAILFCMTAVATHAEQKAEALVIEFMSGETVSFILEEHPKLTFSGTELVITSPSYETSYPLSDLKRYTFKFVEVSGITSVQDNADGIRQTDGTVIIDGAAPGTAITVYSSSGITAASVTADNTGRAVINTSPLPSGVYIIKYGDKTTKIRKP